LQTLFCFFFSTFSYLEALSSRAIAAEAFRHHASFVLSTHDLPLISYANVTVSGVGLTGRDQPLSLFLPFL